MKIYETKLLALEDGRAVVSTDELFRIVKMPEGRIVGELADVWEAIGQVTRDGFGRHGVWRIAMTYKLCRILEGKDVSLNDLAIQPIGKDCCPWCGAHDLSEFETEYECGSSIHQEQSNDSNGFERTEECEQGERERRELMVRKSATLREILLDAGVDLSDEDEMWLFDARPADGQFISPEVAIGELGGTGEPASAAAETRGSAGEDSLTPL